MPIRNEDHAAQYGVLIHSMEVAGPHEQWTSPSAVSYTHLRAHET